MRWEQERARPEAGYDREVPLGGTGPDFEVVDNSTVGGVGERMGVTEKREADEDTHTVS